MSDKAPPFPQPVVPDLTNLRKFERPRPPKPGTEGPTIVIPGDNDVSNEPPQREPERYKQLGVEEIQQYADNPRTQRNSEYDTIKEALRTGGLGAVILHVTKRPGETKYTVSNGGNTRLQIIQELWEETQDMRFRAVRCLIQPFDSDVHMLARHVSENSQRGDLCFWDTAAAIVKLRQRLDLEFATTHSNRDFAERAKSYGLSINQSALSYYDFVVRTFGHLEFSVYLSRRMTEKVQPLWMGIERLQKLSSLDVAGPIEALLQSLDEQWYEKVGIDDEQLLKQLALTASQTLGFSLVEFEKALELSRDRSLDTWDKLVQRARLQKASRPARAAAAPSTSPALPAIKNDAPAMSLAMPIAPTITIPPVPVHRAPGHEVPPNETLVDRLYRLASLICLFHQLPKGVVQRCDLGVGWFLEPLSNELCILAQPGLAQKVQMNTWNILAMLSGQWNRDVIEALPREGVWTRLMTPGTNGLKLERQCLAALPPAQLSWADWLYGANPWGTRTYWLQLTGGEWSTVHDSMMDLTQGVFELQRTQPQRFAHIKRYGNPKTIREVWE